MAGPMLTFNANVRVTVAGVDLGFARTSSGGGRTATGVLIRMGGQTAGVAATEPPSYGEYSVTLVEQHETNSGLVQWLNEQIGQRATFVEQPTDQRGKAGFHRPITRGGVVTGASGPDTDADGNNPREITVTAMIDQLT